MYLSDVIHLVLPSTQNQGPLHRIPGGRCRGPYTHHHICHGCVSRPPVSGSIKQPRGLGADKLLVDSAHCASPTRALSETRNAHPAIVLGTPSLILFDAHWNGEALVRSHSMSTPPSENSNHSARDPIRCCPAPSFLVGPTRCETRAPIRVSDWELAEILEANAPPANFDTSIGEASLNTAFQFQSGIMGTTHTVAQPYYHGLYGETRLLRALPSHFLRAPQHCRPRKSP